MTVAIASSSSERPEPVLDVSVVAALAEIAAGQDLSELEIDHGGLRIRVARERRGAPTAAPAKAVPAAPIAAEHPGLVKSPMVGTAYVRPEPDARPFVEIGAEVKAGDTLLLIEATPTLQ